MMRFSPKEIQNAISRLGSLFEKDLCSSLSLSKVDAPLLVRASTGLNDGLNGTERPVFFDAKDIPGRIEVVQSLAKWKRHALKRYGFLPGEGIVTDMVAIRRDEDISPIHSLTVRQWDWERVITRGDRHPEFLFLVVQNIYKIIKDAQMTSFLLYPGLYTEGSTLPDKITIISTLDLEKKYPSASPKEREHLITREKGAVFLYQIGDRHDGRAPDYDDWTLNGDILVWNTVAQRSLELSSMGIRVDAESLRRQCKIEERMQSPYHRAILDGVLPLTIGGGIGQSRLHLFLLKRHHIGEVQASLWDASTEEKCSKEGLFLL